MCVTVAARYQVSIAQVSKLKNSKWGVVVFFSLGGSFLISRRLLPLNPKENLPVTLVSSNVLQYVAVDL